VRQQQYRWSGLAGIAGGLLFIFVFIFVGVVVGADTSIGAFPEIRAGRTIENTLYLAVILLWVAPFLALGRALRDTSPAAATYGSVVGVVGLGILAAGALPHTASVSIADLYHAPGADHGALAAAWQVNQAIMNMLLVTGLVVLPVGVICLGLAMHGSPAFGRGIGRASVALGLIGAAAAVVLLVDPLSPIAVVGYLALVAFHIAVGWRLYARSRVPVESGAWTAAATGRSAG
jgi:hypothetical protein